MPYGVLSAGLMFGNLVPRRFYCYFNGLGGISGDLRRGRLRGIVAKGKPEGRSGWGRTVGGQLLILVVTLGVAEVVLRVIDLRYLRAHRVGADRIYNYDAELGWFPVPNSDISFTGIRTIRVRHKHPGLRDIEHDTAAKPTIAFLADSFVWGYDAEQNER